jgi:hypothetical protein
VVQAKWNFISIILLSFNSIYSIQFSGGLQFFLGGGGMGGGDIFLGGGASPHTHNLSMLCAMLLL